MGKKTTIVLISILSAFIIMSSGYGKWQKELTIEGSIKVIPDPKVLEAMESELDELILQEELRIAEELRVAEEQQKQLDSLLNPVIEEETTQPNELIKEDDAIESDDPVNNEKEPSTELIIEDNNTVEDVKEDKAEKEEVEEEEIVEEQEKK